MFLLFRSGPKSRLGDETKQARQAKAAALEQALMFKFDDEQSVPATLTSLLRHPNPDLSKLFELDHPTDREREAVAYLLMLSQRFQSANALVTYAALYERFKRDQTDKSYELFCILYAICRTYHAVPEVHQLTARLESIGESPFNLYASYEYMLHESVLTIAAIMRGPAVTKSYFSTISAYAANALSQAVASMIESERAEQFTLLADDFYKQIESANEHNKAYFDETVDRLIEELENYRNSVWWIFHMFALPKLDVIIAAVKKERADIRAAENLADDASPNPDYRKHLLNIIRVIKNFEYQGFFWATSLAAVRNAFINAFLHTKTVQERNHKRLVGYRQAQALYVEQRLQVVTDTVVYELDDTDTSRKEEKVTLDTRTSYNRLNIYVNGKNIRTAVAIATRHTDADAKSIDKVIDAQFAPLFKACQHVSIQQKIQETIHRKVCGEGAIRLLKQHVIEPLAGTQIQICTGEKTTNLEAKGDCIYLYIRVEITLIRDISNVQDEPKGLFADRVPAALEQRLCISASKGDIVSNKVLLIDRTNGWLHQKINTAVSTSQRQPPPGL